MHRSNHVLDFLNILDEDLRRNISRSVSRTKSGRSASPRRRGLATTVVVGNTTSSGSRPGRRMPPDIRVASPFSSTESLPGMARRPHKTGHGEVEESALLDYSDAGVSVSGTSLFPRTATKTPLNSHKPSFGSGSTLQDRSESDASRGLMFLASVGENAPKEVIRDVLGRSDAFSPTSEFWIDISIPNYELVAEQRGNALHSPTGRSLFALTGVGQQFFVAYHIVVAVIPRAMAGAAADATVESLVEVSRRYNQFADFDLALRLEVREALQSRFYGQMALDDSPHQSDEETEDASRNQHLKHITGHRDVQEQPDGGDFSARTSTSTPSFAPKRNKAGMSASVERLPKMRDPVRIPPLPAKMRSVIRKDYSFHQRRRADLEHWLRSVMLIPEVRRSRALAKFLEIETSGSMQSGSEQQAAVGLERQPSPTTFCRRPRSALQLASVQVGGIRHNISAPIVVGDVQICSQSSQSIKQDDGTSGATASDTDIRASDKEDERKNSLLDDRQVSSMTLSAVDITPSRTKSDEAPVAQHAEFENTSTSRGGLDRDGLAAITPTLGVENRVMTTREDDVMPSSAVDMNINVSEPTLEVAVQSWEERFDAEGSAFIAYCLQVHAFADCTVVATWTQRRRFRDFLHLRAQLIAHAGEEICEFLLPPLPGKYHFIADPKPAARAPVLERFLSQVLSDENYIYFKSCPGLRRFLGVPETLEM
ncbi:unnamed protein product [Amoebophrya sp. A25]|nr:unnamed protein product [Amoebophrya sp. A25]|eukprot:GSA25T00022614001.1